MTRLKRFAKTAPVRAATNPAKAAHLGIALALLGTSWLPRSEWTGVHSGGLCASSFEPVAYARETLQKYKNPVAYRAGHQAVISVCN